MNKIRCISILIFLAIKMISTMNALSLSKLILRWAQDAIEFLQLLCSRLCCTLLIFMLHRCLRQLIECCDLQCDARVLTLTIVRLDDLTISNNTYQIRICQNFFKCYFTRLFVKWQKNTLEQNYLQITQFEIPPGSKRLVPFNRYITLFFSLHC